MDDEENTKFVEWEKFCEGFTEMLLTMDNTGHKYDEVIEAWKKYTRTKESERRGESTSLLVLDAYQNFLDVSNSVVKGGEIPPPSS